MNVDLITTIATDILDLCRSAYDEDGAPDIPGRVMLYHTLPPADCEQLVVAIGAVRAVKDFPNQDPGPNKCMIVPAVDLTIVVVRTCWPAPKTSGVSAQNPAAEEISRASALLASDAAALWTVIAAAAVAGRLVSSQTSCSQVTLGALTATAPSGGFVGWRWPLTVQVG